MNTIANNQTDTSILAGSVLAHGQQIATAKSDISRIQSAIDERKTFIAQAKASIPATPDRQQERSNIMADIALGVAKDSALKAIDKLIANEAAAAQAAQAEVAQVIADTQATVDGLLNKLATAQRALEVIESKTTEVAHQYLMGQAQIAAAQYVDHALALKELYLKLYGLGISIKKHGGRDVTGYGPKDIKIPKFNLPYFDGVESFPRQEPGVILNGDFYMYGDFFQKAASKEEEEFFALLQS